MRVFEFMCEKNRLIIVKSKYNVKQTVRKLIDKEIKPVSYLELDKNDIEDYEVDYTLK